MGLPTGSGVVDWLMTILHNFFLVAIVVAVVWEVMRRRFIGVAVAVAIGAVGAIFIYDPQLLVGFGQTLGHTFFGGS